MPSDQMAWETWLGIKCLLETCSCGKMMMAFFRGETTETAGHLVGEGCCPGGTSSGILGKLLCGIGHSQCRCGFAGGARAAGKVVWAPWK